MVQCDCGFEARADDEDGLVEEVQRHAWEAHGMALSHDEALVVAFRAELGASSQPRLLAIGQLERERRKHETDL